MRVLCWWPVPTVPWPPAQHAHSTGTLQSTVMTGTELIRSLPEPMNCPRGLVPKSSRGSIVVLVRSAKATAAL